MAETSYDSLITIEFKLKPGEKVPRLIDEDEPNYIVRLNKDHLNGDALMPVFKEIIAQQKAAVPDITTANVGIDLMVTFFDPTTDPLDVLKAASNLARMIENVREAFHFNSIQILLEQTDASTGKKRITIDAFWAWMLSIPESVRHITMGALQYDEWEAPKAVWSHVRMLKTIAIVPVVDGQWIYPPVVLERPKMMSPFAPMRK
ncbi:MAG: hypothetical protein AB7P49_04595 [Bdellovibrionales bacterium]